MLSAYNVYYCYRFVIIETAGRIMIRSGEKKHKDEYRIQYTRRENNVRNVV